MEDWSELAGTRVLLVDDDPLIRESLMLFLGDNGVQLTNCRTLGEALEALRENCYDVLICDQYLLLSDAENAFDCIKASVPRLPRIIFTGPVSVDARTQAKLEGTVAFIPKPFSAKTITAALFSSVRRGPAWRTPERESMRRG
jgi:DNA-binding NtrC family response regulator